MVVKNICDNTGISAVFFIQNCLTMVNNRMMISKIVNAPVKKNAFSYHVRVVVVVASFNIITNKISNTDFIRISGKIYMCQKVHGFAVFY